MLLHHVLSAGRRQLTLVGAITASIVTCDSAPTSETPPGATRPSSPALLLLCFIPLLLGHKYTSEQGQLDTS
jgi:hypothetical protein